VLVRGPNIMRGYLITGENAEFSATLVQHRRRRENG